MRHLESRSFVGRAAELAVLEEVLAAAAGGRASVVLIGGEAGVGKTRLVAELAARARERAVVATGACVELTAGTAPYLALTELVRDLARALPERAWERLRAGAGPELEALLPGARGRERVRADDAARARLFGQVHDLVVEAAATTPLVLVLEDVHWADRSTLDLTGFLARALGSEGVVLVGTYRSDEVPRRPALRSWLAEIGRVGAVRLELAPFTTAEVADLCAAIRGAAAAPATTAEIARRSGGNAFLAEELLAAVEEGDPERLPVSVRDVLDARIAALDAAAQEAIRAAAVAGARVDDELLAELVPGTDLATALREAVAHHVLVADARDGRLSFRHELAREAAYAGLLPGERRRLHAACARVLSERPELGESPAATAAAIAGHWHAAGDDRSALAASVRAADAAEGVDAFAEAGEQYERALALWDRVADPERTAGVSRLAILERGATVLLKSGAAPRAMERLDEALELADAERDPVATGALHSRRAWTSWAAGSGGERTYEDHAAALRLIPAEPPSAERGQAVTDLAFTEMLNSHHVAAAAAAREAVAIARRIPDRRIESLALTVLGSAVGTLGDMDEALGSLRAAVDIARTDGLPEELGRAYVNYSAMLDQAGRLDDSVAAALEGAEACGRLGLDRYWGAFLRGNAAEALVWLGRYAEAEDVLAGIDATTLALTARMNIALSRAEIARCRGNSEASAEALAEVVAVGTAGHTAEMAGSAAITAAEIAVTQGRLDDAREIVHRALVRIDDDARIHAGLVRAGVAVEAALPHPDEAARTRARELLARLDDLGPGAGVDTAVAHAATARAEFSRLGTPAPNLWSAAAAAWEARPAPYQVAYARWREAEALLATGAARSAAAPPLRAAATTARALGAAGLLREAELLAARARIDLTEAPPPAPADADPHGLTPREREILAHLAAGHTNRQIADALFISPRTAGVHVSRILSKLGASTRGEAAATGRFAGLVDDSELERLLRRSAG
jgi:DNA-binding CsgD family transcriptional regulator